MSALLLKLTGYPPVQGMTTTDGQQVFSVLDFINLVCQETGSYSRHAWKYKHPVKTHLSPVMTLLSPSMTDRGLKMLLLIIDNVTTDFRQFDDSVFTRFMTGDTSMIEPPPGDALTVRVHQTFPRGDTGARDRHG